MRSTSGVDVLVAAFAALVAEEQEEAYARFVDVRLARLAAAGGETAVYIGALRKVADLAGVELTPDVYRSARCELVARGEDIPGLSRLIRHFETWALAKEALALSDVMPAQTIEARFRARVEGARRHFTAADMAAALGRCVADVGRVPLLSEYDAWRQKELALMRARGEYARVPSTAAFRRRYGGWAQVLLAHGHSTEEVYLRLEPTPERRPRLAKVQRYTETTLRETLLRCVDEVGHVPMIAEFTEWRQSQIARSRRRSLVLPTDSPYRYRFGTWERALLHFGFSEAEIKGRLVRGRERSNISLRRHHFRLLPKR